MIVMNTIWLKIVAVLVLIMVGIVIVSKISNKPSNPPKPVEPEKTVADTWRHDEQRLRAEPNVVESNVPPQPEAGQPAVAAQPQKFRELTEAENAGASQLFELAITQRKMSRLPGITYGAMVQYCREIIERYPGSEYAYKAKRMLAEVPADKREFFHITADELDLSK